MGPRDDLSASACASKKGESFKATGQEKPADREGAWCPPGDSQRIRGSIRWDHDCTKPLNVHCPKVTLDDKTAGKRRSSK